MELSQKLLNYLNEGVSINIINSNFLLTDMEKIIYTKTFYLNNYYDNMPLSKDLFKLNGLLKECAINSKCIIRNQELYRIIEGDIIDYSAQIIFPVLKNREIVGMAIFFREKTNYIESSTKAPRTIVNFIQRIIG